MVKIMERTSAAIGLIATALLVVPVSYDFAYLTGLSLSFAQVPTTLADHTRSAVLWIPIVGSALLLGIVAGRSLPGAGSISPSRKPPIAHRVVLPLLLMVVVMIVLFPFSSGLRSGADDEVSFLAVASVLGIVAYRIVGHMARNQPPGYWLSAGTVAVAYCCGLAAYFGSAEGKAIRSLREP